MRSIREYLTSDRQGFAISFEIMMTMIMVTLVCSVTAYFAQVFEMERYFADVSASTCVMASRYGGNDSKAYKIQVNKGTIEENANAQLALINANSKGVALQSPNGDGRYISVSNFPDKNNNVTVSVSYKLGNIGWGRLASIVSPGVMTHTFVIPSLMQSGKLIR